MKEIVAPGKEIPPRIDRCQSDSGVHWPAAVGIVSWGPWYPEYNVWWDIGILLAVSADSG